MRLGRSLRTLAIGVYLCVVLLIALRQSYNERPQIDSRLETKDIENDDNDFGDDSLIFGRVPDETGIVDETGGGKRVQISMWSSGEIGPQHLGGCPDYNCRITDDPRLLNQSQAVVFHNGVGGVPGVRSPNQFFVFFTQESPIHMGVDGRYARNFFNLTLGYRRDADVPCPYGYAVKRRQKLKRLSKNITDLISGKDRSVAWFVSNCGAPSGRDSYVAELKKYIDVDVYGGCGTMQCSKSDDCSSMLERRYKFYLAFENSLCKDYATEKFWEKMTLNIVTIVLKRSIVSGQAPPESFLAADDFDSPQSMAAYLKKLIADPNLYARRFDWRLEYRIVYLNGRVHDRLERPWCFCKLCRRLLEKPARPKVYANVDDWWTKDADCDQSLVKNLLSKKTLPK